MLAKTKEIVALATKHAHNGARMESSAVLSLVDAQRALDLTNEAGARFWSMRSLRYSVGMFHPDYRQALELEGACK